MRKIIAVMIMSTAIPFAVSAQETKVVVVPLGSSKAPTCTLRVSDYYKLDTWYKTIDQYCLPDEKIMTGGYENGNYSTLSDCRVIKNKPLTPEDGYSPQDGWRVTWGMPTQTECAAHDARTYALCCKW
ncbi:MAG: hypothetical protein ACYCYR_17380 [Desulfobulbaceae bacterium]